jgi:hypothetical protein
VRYLGLALFAEGPTDHRFLSPLLRRVTEDLCLSRGISLVEVSEVFELHSPRESREADRASRIFSAAREAWGAFHILFVHTDGAGDAEAARLERVEPAAERLEQELAGANACTVAVVPVRETEAWALTDGDALRAAFGARLDDTALGIPDRPERVERIPDPKLALDQVLAAIVGSRRRSKRTASEFLTAIGERVKLARLRQVPAFRCFELDLQAALQTLGYLHIST